MGNVNAREIERQEATGHNDSTQVSLDGIAAQVVKVHIDGVVRTKDDIILDSVKEIFNVTHFEDLVLKAQDVRSRLQEMGCFSQVGIHIDTSETGPRDYEVTFKVQELRRMVGSVNTMVGNQEGSLQTGLKFPNCFGRGERFGFDYTYGTKKTNTFNANFSKPLHGTKSHAATTANIFQQIAEFPQSGFKDLNRGVLLDLNFMSAPQVVHNLQWEGVWRDLRCLNRATAFAVREHAGHTVKSSLKHILTVDRRDNPIFPAEGSLFRLQQEFAGLGGDIGFFKNEVEIQANVGLARDFVLQGSFNCGIIKQLENEKTMTISDRFFLGGPMNIRGFDLRGLGPHADGNSLGGMSYWASGLHLYGPLPFRPGAGGFGDLFRSHVFVNAGNIGQFDLSRAQLEEVVQGFRLSYGVGLAMKLGGIARIELNYVIPIKAEKGDRVAPGVQLGVGVNFL